ncbi:MAG: tetratricopeptide repeat protein, partial [Holophagales bacterium]|nr:tetratricopeptide repeat protein [Holophagales bacterium]
VGRTLRTRLDLAELTPAATREARASQPVDSAGARLYAEGLEHLRMLDGRSAVQKLERAVARSPKSSLMRVSLSSAYRLLGYPEKSKAAARQAYEASDRLSRRDRLWIEAHYFQAVGQRRQAVQNYEALWEYFPDELEYGLRLAEAQTWSGDAEAALETLRRLRQAASDPRIALAEAEAARSLSDYALQQQKAAEAVRGAEAMGASLLVARAREVEGGALRDLGRHESALDAYRAAREIYLEAGLEGPMARLLLAEAQVRRHQGHYGEAEDLAERALEMASESGDLGTRRFALNTLAILHRQRGELRKAQRMHQLEVEANREAERRRSIQISLTTLGVVERDLGLLDSAADHFEEALELAGITDHMRSLAINHNLLGEVELRRGELDSARGHFERALELNRDIRSPRGRAYYLSALAEVDRATGDLESAQRRHEEASRIRRAIGEGDNIARSLHDLARLALDEGRTLDSLDLALESAEAYRELGKRDEEGRALVLAARASFAAGELDRALEQLEEASRSLRGTEAWDPRFWLAFARAEIEGTPAALRRLDLLEQEGTKRGFVDFGLEASILLARLRGDHAELEALARRTEELGFLLLASQARASASRPLG